ncbi:MULTISPECIES: glycosyltransferase family 2 protein [unclassified Olleya]|jgi:glycosyltransferase involved in cell wall biosynthesis|uniref:glycosyltransferase family 2 protein n=1 Tax=unclassified Olleya TaxID=2615019 RepID=UPI00119FD095|nr:MULTISPECIES: glycosyltransferase family 2 protein [unclassified Olleya]TVZ47273.1 glycosyltransferase involved in cell wall biosynthesis [Olleya sp. Hel_I_94]|tara:strand:- start:31216 stop:32151 length:936 start_codon:yes stop_codon:yes gene_type:complete
MSFFSVIIPLYNKEKYVLKTITSVLQQSFQNFDIVIVDDGSTDQSLAIVKSLNNDKITVIQQENQGASIARNTAIAASNGSYIATLDADDIWDKNHLLQLKKCIDTCPEAVLFCTNYNIKRHDGFITKSKFNFEYDNSCLIINDFFKANIINFIPTSSSVAFKKQDFLKVNGYNTKLRTGQDIDLWIKFGLIGKIAFNPKITMLYNFFDQSSLSNSDYNEDRYLLINNYKNEAQNNASLKKYLDINRYALVIRYKLLDQPIDAKKVKQDIDFKNLNYKQKVLVNCPSSILIGLKKLHSFLIKNNIYLSAFK